MTDLASEDELWDLEQVAATEAAARVEFQLTYARSPVRRKFGSDGITGPSIPCAYGRDLNASGDWDDPRPTDPPILNPAGWIDRYAGYAVAEAIHEALEWCRVDGAPWLDPHGPAEQQIHAEVDRFVAALAEIRRQHIDQSVTES
ncbi:hypothetical protein [Polymorphospora lycopeni]|uniref:Uncharacterized protein n=1 Tax=Polymorphospora lycopeni TaxID=3140240 RepID=A0ABV5CKY8_9ACTN